MANRECDFPPAVRLALAQRVNYFCSSPACRRVTVGPHSDPSRSLITGEACHICAASPGGPRYDPNQTPEQRRSAENGVWLCAVCSDKVDKDWAAHPKEVLLKWKADLEREIDSGAQFFARKESDDSDIREALRERRLHDRNVEGFARTEHSLNLGPPSKSGGRPDDPYPLVAVLFALFRRREQGDVIGPPFLDWMKGPHPEYKPVPFGLFIPSRGPNRTRNGHWWSNAGRYGMSVPNSLACSSYLAVERSGYCEYGFVPTSTSSATGPLYYATVVAGTVAFLHWLQDAAGIIKPDRGVHFGIAMRGTAGRRIRGLHAEDHNADQFSSPPADDGLLWQKTLGPVEPWTVDAVAKEVATQVLIHWSHAGADRPEPPEFRNGTYHGDCFRSRFHETWFSRA